MSSGRCAGWHWPQSIGGRGPLEPPGIDLAAAIEHPQRRGAPGGRSQRVEHKLGHEPGHVDHTAVELLERLDYVERQPLEPCQERISFLNAEALPHRRLRRWV